MILHILYRTCNKIECVNFGCRNIRTIQVWCVTTGIHQLMKFVSSLSVVVLQDSYFEHVA